jgi:hypothetical protein
LFLRLQSAYVLPLARGVYLLIAVVCLLTVIGGILYAVYLQASTASQPATVALPPPYQGSAAVTQSSPREVDLAVVGSRLVSPTNIRFVLAAGTITAPPREGVVLGRFVADTPNKLASFPDGISILGGADAELFERTNDAAHQGIGLAARPALVTQISDALRDIKEVTSRTFEIRVVARDEYGIMSAPTDVSLTLRFGPEPAAPAQPTPEAPAAPTDLQAIAREIAQAVEPEVNPARFAVFNAAVKVPGRCGANDGDKAFLANYRRAVGEVRERLTASNVEAFYLGLCDAWKAALTREAAERDREEQKHSAARRAADEARARAQAHNDHLLQQHASRVFEARTQTAVTMSVIGGAFAIFLSVALLLAFLAIEGHSRAIRAAMESMVRLSAEKEAHEVASDSP